MQSSKDSNDESLNTISQKLPRHKSKHQIDHQDLFYLKERIKEMCLNFAIHKHSNKKEYIYRVYTFYLVYAWLLVDI